MLDHPASGVLAGGSGMEHHHHHHHDSAANSSLRLSTTKLQSPSVDATSSPGSTAQSTVDYSDHSMFARAQLPAGLQQALYVSSPTPTASLSRTFVHDHVHPVNPVANSVQRATTVQLPMKRPRDYHQLSPQKSRRASHNATEQRRRNKIKERIDELRGMVPICEAPDRKAVVLGKTIEYIKALTAQYNDLLERSKKLQDEYKQRTGGIGGDYLGHHVASPATGVMLKKDTLPYDEKKVTHTHVPSSPPPPPPHQHMPHNGINDCKPVE